VHDRGAAELHPRLERDIRFDLHRDVDPGRGRVDHGDAGDHPARDQAAIELGSENGELRAVIHSLDRHRVVAADGSHRAAFGTSDRQHIGEVDLALGVVPPDPVEGRTEHLGVEDVHRGVDLGDRALLLGRVALLHHGEDVTGAGLADDPPVAARVRDLGGEDRDSVPVRAMGVEKLGKGRAVEQRDVSREYYDRPVEVRVARGTDSCQVGVSRGIEDA